MNLAWRLATAEAIKLRRTPALVLAVVAPVFGACVVLLQLFTFRFNGSPSWDVIPNNAFAVWFLFFMPMLIAFEAAALSNLEHSGRQWKHLFAMPIPRWGVYATKIAFCILLTAGSLAVFTFGFLVDVLIFSTARDLGLASTIPWLGVLATVGKAFVASWLMIAVQTWLSIRYRGLATSMGIGFAGLVAGLVLLGVFRLDQGAVFNWYPWMLPVATLSDPERRGWKTALPALIGCAGGLVIGAYACWDLARRRGGD